MTTQGTTTTTNTENDNWGWFVVIDGQSPPPFNPYTRHKKVIPILSELEPIEEDDDDCLKIVKHTLTTKIGAVCIVSLVTIFTIMELLALK